VSESAQLIAIIAICAGAFVLGLWGLVVQEEPLDPEQDEADIW
jgi:hypothetical protein